MAKLVLDSKRIECLEVVIDGKSYNVPLGSTLSTKELKGMDEEAMYTFIESHLWEGALEELPVGMVKQMMDAWIKETQKAAGLSLGKSSASRISSKNTARR